MSLALYDLEGRDGRRMSPFCWRAKYALAHKGLAADTRPVGFGGIKEIGDGTFKTVPVLDHDGRLVGDSWQIALYLDERFPETAPVFPNAEALAYAQFVEKWLFAQIFTAMFPAMMICVHDHAREEDRAYLRKSREARLGMTLEEAARRGAEGMGAMTVALEPLRAKVRDTAYLCGTRPGYADYVALSVFLWARACHPKPLLKHDDPVAAWIARGLDLYGGLGRSAPGYDLAA